MLSRACSRVENILQTKVVLESPFGRALNHWSISHRIAERHPKLDQRRMRRECDEELFGGCEVGIAGGGVGNESLLSVSLQSCEGVSDASQAYESNASRTEFTSLSPRPERFTTRI